MLRFTRFFREPNGNYRRDEASTVYSRIMTESSGDVTVRYINPRYGPLRGNQLLDVVTKGLPAKDRQNLSVEIFERTNNWRHTMINSSSNGDIIRFQIPAFPFSTNTDVETNVNIYYEGQQIFTLTFIYVANLNCMDTFNLNNPTQDDTGLSTSDNEYGSDQDLAVWLDANIDIVYNTDCCNTVTQLQKVVSRIHTFTDTNQCIAFMNDIKEEKIFMIVSGALGEIVMPDIHDMSQIDSIYIFCRNELKHRQWADNWLKIKGVFTKILPICEELKQTAQQCDQNTISISFVSTHEELSKQSLDQINQSFMYTQILKEILLTIDFDQQSVNDFIIYCREQFADNPTELININKLEQEYDKDKSIWWYTYECFLYSMLNRALRMMEIDTIIKMGFFIRYLHENIAKLHKEQYSGRRKWHSLTVYRGQGLSKTDFEQLKEIQGGLLSFNNFLSTSKNQNVAFSFARRCILKSDLIGVIFVMTIDHSSSSTPFASIKNVSCFQTEREILLSMHSVFRVGCIKQIDHNSDRLWQVELTLTSDDDPQRRDLTKRIRNETPGLTGWHRLGQFLIMMGQFSKAEDVYKALLDETCEDDDKAQFNHHLGVINDEQGEYDKAIQFYEKSLEINRRILLPDHHFLASSYSGIGLVYSKKGEYSKALLSHEKALEIFQKTLCPYHPLIAKSYGNIGKVYDEMEEHSRALASHQIALTIFQKTLPQTHPSIAICYYDIGKVYDKMGDFSKALASHEKALDIRTKILPSKHPLLAASYNSVGELYIKMGEDSKGVSCIRRAIDVGQQSLPANHPDLERYRNSLKLFETI